MTTPHGGPPALPTEQELAEVVADLLDGAPGEDPTPEQVRAARDRLRHPGAGYAVMVRRMSDHGRLSPDTARVVVPEAWASVAQPLDLLPQRFSADPRGEPWRALFRLAGLTVDGVMADPSAAPSRVWRGATVENAGGWSWCTGPAAAQAYAGGARMGKAGRGRLWHLAPAAERVLAVIGDPDAAGQVVVDTHGLTVGVDIVEVVPA